MSDRDNLTTGNDKSKTGLGLKRLLDKEERKKSHKGHRRPPLGTGGLPPGGGSGGDHPG